MRLEGRIALVTGASTGIGAAVAITLAREGARVGVNYLRSEAAAHTVVTAITAMGAEAYAIPADVREKADVQKMVESVVTRWGGLNILVNSAGTLGARSGVADLSLEVWEEVIGVNLTGTFLCCQAVIEPMSKSGGGHIVNIGSATVKTGGAGGSVHYSAAKAGVVALTRGLARELAPRGIQVNVISPGIIDTPFHGKFSPPGAIAKRVTELPIPRAGRPEEIAAGVLFLLTEGGSYMTGAELDINGGLAIG